MLAKFAVLLFLLAALFPAVRRRLRTAAGLALSLLALFLVVVMLAND